MEKYIKNQHKYTEYMIEKEIGELQEKTLECAEFARKLGFLLINKESNYKREILKDIIEDLRKAAQKVGWIDTRV